MVQDQTEECNSESDSETIIDKIVNKLNDVYDYVFNNISDYITESKYDDYIYDEYSKYMDDEYIDVNEVFDNIISSLLLPLTYRIKFNTRHIKTVTLSDALNEISMLPYMVKLYYANIDKFYIVVFSEHNLNKPFAIFNYLVDNVNNVYIRCKKCGYVSKQLYKKENLYNYKHICNKRFLYLRGMF